MVGNVSETADETKKREIFEKFQKDEAAKKAKLEQKAQDKVERDAKKRELSQVAKEDREAFAKTPEGRARAWLGGLQEPSVGRAW